MKRRPLLAAAAIALAASVSHPATAQETLTGQAAFTNYAKEHPGVRRKLTAADLPAPYASPSVVNHAALVPRPPDAWPQALPGFKVELYAEGLSGPRLIRFAPNGDLFVAESKSGEIKVLRGVGKDGKAQQIEVFASGLTLPFGINFYPSGHPQWVYVANTNSVVRFPYQNGDLEARGPAETVVRELPGSAQLAGGGDWTRDIVFTGDGAHMLVSVGSHSNDDNTDNNPAERHRADILEFTPDGTFERVYAWGIRNCVGEAVNPVTGDLWCSANERDGLGNNLVPDYITHVEQGGFYGWPWFYIGGHKDPRQMGRHPELQSKVIEPDVLLQPHFASLEMTFYQGIEFPSMYQGWAFAAEHGSWNREDRAGYEIIAVPMKDGHATGEYEDFLTGFTRPDGGVWGRPVGVAVSPEGSLLVSDDGSNSIWRVTYVSHKSATYPLWRTPVERASR